MVHEDQDWMTHEAREYIAVVERSGVDLQDLLTRVAQEHTGDALVDVATVDRALHKINAEHEAIGRRHLARKRVNRFHP